MTDQDLIDASEEGNLKLVQQLLKNKKININCTNIFIQNNYGEKLNFLLLIQKV